MNYDALFVNPTGRTSRESYVPALITVLAVISFYAFVVTGRTAEFCMLVLQYPLFVLLARRVRDMGFPALLVIVPVVPVLAGFGVRLGYFSLGTSVDGVLPWIAIALTVAFAAWGCAGRSKAPAPGPGPTNQ